MSLSSRIVDNAPDKNTATTNFVYVSPADSLGKNAFVEIGSFVFRLGAHPGVPEGSVGMNSQQRKIVRASVRDPIDVLPYTAPPSLPTIGLMYAEVQWVVDKGRTIELQANDLIEKILREFKDQVISASQQVVFEFQGGNYKFAVSSLLIDENGTNKDTARGWLRENTAFVFLNSNTHTIKILGQKGYATTQIFKHKQLNFEQLGIGGLDKQFEAIFRRAFASRVFPPSIVQRLGIHHVKGMLLYGPPGTGKTLIARQIGKMLNGKEPKIVNGPEVLSKYVGDSEAKIRELFADAELEYKQKGDNSELHIIIFDEIDAITKSRGSTRDNTGVNDSIVNQLLTKIDGVDALNNILLIGMTNRRDMMDDALLRPGRLEVQIEIGLPDEKGRLQILKIHTTKMSTNSFLARDVDLVKLAEQTRNFSGAEIEGLVKSATSFALNRNVDIDDLQKPLDEENLKVTMDDFLHALDEVKPAFGAQMETLNSYSVHGVFSYGDMFDHLVETLTNLVGQVQHSDTTPMLSCLLSGPAGSGKSSLAATVGLRSAFPFVKVCSAETMVGYSESSKSSAIAKVFEDAYKSPLSIVILDDIERLLEYVAIGPRFSNAVLQTLLVLVKRHPPAGRKLLVIGTTSMGDVMESMGLSDVFNVNLHVPALGMTEIVSVLRQMDVFEISDVPRAVSAVADALKANVFGTQDSVPVKKLMLWVEAAKHDLPKGSRIPLDRWQQVLRTHS